MHDFEIRVDPMSIPARIEVDITTLAIGKSIHVGDIAVPEGVEVLDDVDATVCTCAAPKEEKAAEPTDAAVAAAVAEPEVLAKGKKEEEDAEAAEKKA